MVQMHLQWDLLKRQIFEGQKRHKRRELKRRGIWKISTCRAIESKQRFIAARCKALRLGKGMNSTLTLTVAMVLGGGCLDQYNGASRVRLRSAR